MKKFHLVFVFNILFANIFLISMQEELPVLLMLGYNRDADYLTPFPKFIKILWGRNIDQQIATSTMIQKMQLITIDSRQSCLNKHCKHIQTDPTQYDFSRDYNCCKQIFIQMPSSQRDFIK